MPSKYAMTSNVKCDENWHYDGAFGASSIWLLLPSIQFNKMWLFTMCSSVLQFIHRPVHPPYSSVFSTEFNPEYGNTDTLTSKAMKLSLMFPDSRIAAGKFLTVTKLLIILLSNAP